MNKATEFFLTAVDKIQLPYFDEVETRRNMTFEKCTENVFFAEYVYAVMNLGMREQAMRPIYEKFIETLDIDDVKTRFPKKQKAAISRAKTEFVRWFGELKCAKDKVEYLQSLPLIGKTTKWHLAQNLGIDCVKPDIHLIRLSKRFGFTTPLEMCKKIQEEIGNAEKLSVIDLILWRYCNLYGSDVNE
jgi:predicted nucleic acid-binding OB-fold protein